MKLLTLAAAVVLSTATAAFAQQTTTPPNPNNCSPAFPNCSSVINGNNKTPGNTPGTSRNEMRQEGQIPQTAREPAPMNTFDCPPGQVNCVPPSHPGATTGSPPANRSR
jgi:hypothetical protein